jgi:Stress responsive A/B Barrel Domain.
MEGKNGGRLPRSGQEQGRSVPGLYARRRPDLKRAGADPALITRKEKFMIRHIVLFKIKDEFKDEIPLLVRNFYGMKGKIEGMVSLEAGADFLGSERSYDLALITEFETREAFDAYQTHPVHLPVKKRMHEVRESSVACDYVIPD